MGTSGPRPTVLVMCLVALLQAGCSSENPEVVYDTTAAKPMTPRGTRERLALQRGPDLRLIDRVGVVAETSIQYWDVSPWEISLVGRVDLIDGLRLRGGLALPVAVWAGWTPTDREAGAREATLFADLGAGF